MSVEVHGAKDLCGQSRRLPSEVWALESQSSPEAVSPRISGAAGPARRWRDAREGVDVVHPGLAALGHPAQEAEATHPRETAGGLQILARQGSLPPTPEGCPHPPPPTGGGLLLRYSALPDGRPSRMAGRRRARSRGVSGKAACHRWRPWPPSPACYDAGPWIVRNSVAHLGALSAASSPRRQVMAEPQWPICSWGLAANPPGPDAAGTGAATWLAGYLEWQRPALFRC